MKIVSPPQSLSMGELVKLVVEKVQLGAIPSATDKKGRYLHWDKIRHLEVPEAFDSIEQFCNFLAQDNKKYCLLPKRFPMF